MLRKFFTIIAALFAVLNTVSAADEKTIVMGGKKGWPVLSKMDGIVVGKGKFGFDSLELATNSSDADEWTDFLVNFEGGNIRDVTGNYDIESNTIVLSKKALMGKHSGLSKGNGGLRLDGSPNSLFGKPGPTGSFLIEFWLCPSIAENGEVVFSWRSSRTVSNYPLYQMISASFASNHLEWSFTNIFNGYIENGGEITLQSYRTIIPEVWLHHSISFDQETGLLEYRINGQLESLKFITTSGHENGSVYSPQLGVPASFDICPKYTGLIDDFRIRKTSLSEASLALRYDTYKVDGGRFETDPILLSEGSRVTRIDAVVDIPEQTDIEFYVRSGDNYFNWTSDYPEWKHVSNHEEISGLKGLYFQVAADFFPDGGGAHSPSVTELKVSYEEVPSPLPPFTVYAVPGNGEVTLSWAYSVDDTVGGYYIFYGDRPGEYLGTGAAEGGSPIEVGNVTSVTIGGLKNGKIYYFAIASYSRLDSRIMGELSKEVYARPMKK